MQSYQFFNTVVLRTPAFSYEYYTKADWHSLLKEARFLDAIKQASPVVYDELQKIQFHADRLTPKLTKTLKRYFNRMCFRPTPFATMASLSITSFGENEAPVVLTGNIQPHYGPDFKSIITRFSKEPMDNYDRLFVANESLYETGTHWRYLFYQLSDDNKKRNFQIVSIAMTDAITAVISICREPLSLRGIISVIARQFAAKESECRDFVLSLIERQVLLPENLPGVSGYSSIRGRNLEEMAVADRSYIITERQTIAGNIPVHFQNELLEALSVAENLSSATKSKGLDEFRKAFRKKFDMQAVPLLCALDPETGVGYQELASAVTQDSIVKDLPEIKKTEGAQIIEWTPAHTYLLSKWADACDKGVLEIKQDEIDGLRVSQQPATPPTFSVMGRIADGHFYMESAGGCSALPLLGRFTVLGAPFADFASSIARKEEEMNPEVIIAEVVHFSETHTANIERRFAIRQFEIPVVTSSGVTRETQIPLNDLLVKLENDTIILWSIRHQKRVIPRLSSAFNYQRSDLPVFRFLCDLQHQEVSNNFCPSLRHYFPGQSYYPRLQYKNVAYQLATWILPFEEKMRVLADNGNSDIENLTQWLISKKCPRYLSVSEHDNQIIVDTDQPDGLIVLLDFFREKKPLTLTEFPFVDNSQPLVQDASGNGFINQVVLSLYKKESVYEAPKGEVVRVNGDLRRDLLPGCDWLYFKIYCTPMRANEILVSYVMPLVQKLRSEELICSYFFMRFTEDGFHLRLRFLLSDAKHCGAVMLYVSECFTALHSARLIGKVQLDTYEREVERYSEELMERVETFFCYSSDSVLHFLQHICNDATGLQYYRVGFAVVGMIYDAFELNIEDRIKVSEFFYRAFSKEYNHDEALEQKARDVFRQIGLQYGMQTMLNAKEILPDEILYNLTAILADINAHKKVLNAKRINQLVGSMIHLHLNRLFTDHSRMQEMVVYYCLWKYYSGLAARSKKHVNQESLPGQSPAFA